MLRETWDFTSMVHPEGRGRVEVLAVTNHTGYLHLRVSSRVLVFVVYTEEVWVVSCVGSSLGQRFVR